MPGDTIKMTTPLPPLLKIDFIRENVDIRKLRRALKLPRNL